MPVIDPRDEIVRLTAELAASQERERGLREAVEAGIDLAEFWIERGREVNMCEERYNIWLALGHHSGSLRKMRAALAQEAGSRHVPD